MVAKSSLILTLVMGLFFSTQVFPVTMPAEAVGGECAKMQCEMGCCANKACCLAMQQHRAPKPMSETARVDLQVAREPVRALGPIYFLEPAARVFAIREEASLGHAPPLLAVNCIRLI